MDATEILLYFGVRSCLRMAELSRITEEIVHERAKALGNSVLIDSSERETHFTVCYIEDLQRRVEQLNQQYGQDKVLDAFRQEINSEKFSLYFERS